jgi:hypothetical protein
LSTIGERADICRQITTDEKIVTDIKSDVAKWQARCAAQPQKKKVALGCCLHNALSVAVSGGSATELSATDAWLGAVVGDETHIGTIWTARPSGT